MPCSPASLVLFFGGPTQRGRAFRRAVGLVWDPPPGLGARLGPGPGTTPGPETVNPVLEQCFSVWPATGSQLTSDLPVSESKPPILQCTFSVGLSTGSRSSLDFSVSQCALFRFIPGFKRDKNCLETEIFLFRDRNISVSKRKIFLFGNGNFTVSIQSNFRFRTENISVFPQNKLFCSCVSLCGPPNSTNTRRAKKKLARGHVLSQIYYW